MLDKVQGCLVGLAVGDALGAPLEFQPRRVVKRLYPHPLAEMIMSPNWGVGEYTDDTKMALCIADSLVEKKGFSAQDVAARFLTWLVKDGKGCGNQIGAVLESDLYLQDPFGCSERYFLDHPSNAAGNGALMRCAPLALFWLYDPVRLEKCTIKAAQLTHWDPKAVESCLILNKWIRESILFYNKDPRPAILEAAKDPAWYRLSTIETLSSSEIESTGYTVHTLEAALWSFLTTQTFEDAVVRAANLGDDADTVAAVTGALAGAYYGYAAIPLRWRQNLMNREHLERVAQDLVEGIFA